MAIVLTLPHSRFALLINRSGERSTTTVRTGNGSGGEILSNHPPNTFHYQTKKIPYSTAIHKVTSLRRAICKLRKSAKEVVVSREKMAPHNRLSQRGYRAKLNADTRYVIYRCAAGGGRRAPAKKENSRRDTIKGNDCDLRLRTR